MNSNEEATQERSTYNELVIESITNPTNMIALPDRQSSMLR